MFYIFIALDMFWYSWIGLNRDLDRNYVGLSKTHDMMILKKVSFKIKII